MEALPHIVTDLALILIVAGLVTIVFKRLHQPLVLGYIVAGFLAGPHMPYTPTVDSIDDLNVWSQIGVIFMMFSLGLEFSFKKIVGMGWGPMLSALCIMASMMGIGSAVGKLFGWSSMNSLFLGGMLAMSSTTIIYKAFADLGLSQRKFAKGVMSVLIIEDILGIVLMVVLSAMAVGRGLEGSELLLSLLKLGFILCLWFIVGIFIVPLFLKKNSRYINTETLLIVSIGLCFLLVILANKAGYSPAFGAFMMGSILAETVEAERIENAIRGVKDLFGAIFFVSVGMLVDPQILVQYWLPILVIVLSIIIGQSVFGTLSFILSGQNLRGGMQSGFSMAQIGEFAFIIASLGVSLHVTDAFLYPVVVAVSIITTFFTPYMIKLADPVYRWIEGRMPKRVKSVIDKNSRLSIHEEGDEKSKGYKLNGKNSHASQIPLEWLVGYNPGFSYIDKQVIFRSQGAARVWRSLLKQLFAQTMAYFILTIAVVLLSLASLLPFCRSVFTHWPGNAVCGVLILLIISLFLRPIVMRKNHSEEFIFLRRRGLFHRLLLALTIVIRYVIAAWPVYYVLDYLSPYKWWLHIIISLVIVFIIISNKTIKYYSIRMERTFRHNLSRRDRLEADRDETAYANRLHGRDIHIASLTLPEDSNWAGKSLMQLGFGREDNIIVVAIVRGESRINIPAGNAMLYPRDVVEVVGDDESIEAFSQRLMAERTSIDSSAHRLHISRMVLKEDSPVVNKSICEADIRQQLHSIIIGVELEDGTLQVPTADQILKVGDVLWLVG